jgi:hypothetical protein
VAYAANTNKDEAVAAGSLHDFYSAGKGLQLCSCKYNIKYPDISSSVLFSIPQVALKNRILLILT